MNSPITTLVAFLVNRTTFLPTFLNTLAGFGNRGAGILILILGIGILGKRGLGILGNLGFGIGGILMIRLIGGILILIGGTLMILLINNGFASFDSKENFN